MQEERDQKTRLATCVLLFSFGGGLLGLELLQLDLNFDPEILVLIGYTQLLKSFSLENMSKFLV